MEEKCEHINVIQRLVCLVDCVDSGSVTYQAQSPDESALVLTARDFGFVFKVTLSSTTGFLSTHSYSLL